MPALPGFKKLAITQLGNEELLAVPAAGMALGHVAARERPHFQNLVYGQAFIIDYDAFEVLTNIAGDFIFQHHLWPGHKIEAGGTADIPDIADTAERIGIHLESLFIGGLLIHFTGITHAEPGAGNTVMSGHGRYAGTDGPILGIAARPQAGSHVHRWIE